jgi:hypothetical protein
MIIEQGNVVICSVAAVADCKAPAIPPSPD